MFLTLEAIQLILTQYFSFMCKPKMKGNSMVEMIIDDRLDGNSLRDDDNDNKLAEMQDFKEMHPIS